MPDISSIDPNKGKLYFRGLDIVDLVQKNTFESVLYLLVHGHLPSKDELAVLTSKMSQYRQKSSEVLAELSLTPKGGGINAMMDFAKKLDYFATKLKLDAYDSLLFFVTISPIVDITQYNLKHRMETLLPRDNLGHSANILWMLGKSVIENNLRYFETCLILHMDDPDNPPLNSLITALSSGESISNALSYALEKFGGPLHYAAGFEVMKMLEELSKASNLEDAISRRLEQGDRIFGLGHRVYNTIDPRALVLKSILGEIPNSHEEKRMLQFIDDVASIASELILKQKGRKLHPNVDLYNAFLYSTCNIDSELTTDLFAIARTAGWMAHILDWMESNQKL